MVRKNRFWIWLVSKRNWEDGWDEEMMVDKETGEVLIKSPDGNILSYPYMARLNNHIDAFSDKINDMGLKGFMSMMVNSTNTLPMRIDFNDNIIEEPVLLGSELKQVMVSVSSDSIITTGITPRIVQVPFNYSIELRDPDDNIVSNYNYEVTYDESLTKILNINTYDVDYDKAYITDIHLVSDPNVVYETTPINIIHSVLVFIGGGK